MDLIFDIGANKGLFTDECLKKFSNSKIVVIEPNDNLFDFLTVKYQKFKDQIFILNNLVSSTYGEEIEFFICETDTISTASLDWVRNSRFSNEFTWNKKVKKTSVNLDNLVKKFGKPNLIKIDVEGYEYEVVKGLSSKQEKLCFEWAEEQKENIVKTCEHLKNIGYNYFGSIEGDEYLKEPESYTTFENFSLLNNLNAEKKQKWGKSG
jgi:FkbM family methyltransferase